MRVGTEGFERRIDVAHAVFSGSFAIPAHWYCVVLHPLPVNPLGCQYLLVLPIDTHAGSLAAVEGVENHIKPEAAESEDFHLGQ